MSGVQIHGFLYNVATQGIDSASEKNGTIEFLFLHVTRTSIRKKARYGICMSDVSPESHWGDTVVLHVIIFSTTMNCTVSCSFCYIFTATVNDQLTRSHTI